MNGREAVTLERATEFYSNPNDKSPLNQVQIAKAFNNALRAGDRDGLVGLFDAMVGHYERKAGDGPRYIRGAEREFAIFGYFVDHGATMDRDFMPEVNPDRAYRDEAHQGSAMKFVLDLYAKRGISIDDVFERTVDDHETGLGVSTFSVIHIQNIQTD